MKASWEKKIYAGIGILIGLLYIQPVYMLLISSFKNQKGIFQNILKLPDHLTFTLANYKTAFMRLDFSRSFLNSLIISVCSTVLIVICSSMAAWVLVRYKNKTSKFLFLIFAASMLIPFQSVMLPLISIMNKIHFLNPPGIIFMYVGFGASLSVVLYHGFMKGIPLELEEAAYIDGCSGFRIFWSVVFPLLKVINVTVSILNVMWIWNDFLLPQLMINKKGWQTLPLKTFLFFGQFTKRWDYGTAGLVMVLIPIVIFYLFSQKHIVKGITQGAVKG